MIIVKVTYTTKPGYAVQNRNNIKVVMNDLQQLNYPGIFYTVCVGADGVSFIHTAYFNSEEDRKLLNELPSFKHFQEQLKSVGIETPPMQELLTLVGSSTNIFKGN